MTINKLPDARDLEFLRTRMSTQFQIPSAYDDALSYQGLIYKLIQYLKDTMQNVEDWNVWLEDFVSTFDENLNGIIRDTVQEWVDDGTIQVIISEALQGNLDEYKDEINTAVSVYKAQTDQLINGYKIDSDIKLSQKASTEYVNNRLSSIVSSSPKGVYANLDSLNASLPTGDVGVYLTADTGEWYYYNGGWVSGGLYQSSGITDKSIGIEKLANTKVFKNLYDKTKITEGVSVDYTTGTFPEVPTYNASDFIPLTAGLTYTKNAPYQFAYYTESKEYISGVGNDINTFTVPENVVYGRFTLKDEDIDSFQIELGNRTTNPSEYMEVFDIQVIPRQDNTYKVSRVGGNLETISGGIYYLKSLGLIEPVTMLVYPGIYEENITELKGDSKISLVGINKRDTIIIDKSGDYYKCPLQIAGENYIANLTVIANHDGVEVIPPIPSYAFHSDYNYTGTTLIENCTFESYQNAAVGLGLFPGQKIEFRNCKLYSDSLYDGGSLYFHNAVASGGAPMELLLVNCEIISRTGNALVMDDANIGSGDGLGNDMTVTFINCFVWSEELGKNCVRTNVPPNEETCAVGSVKLGTKSSGNNLEIINYKH